MKGKGIIPTTNATTPATADAWIEIFHQTVMMPTSSALMTNAAASPSINICVVEATAPTATTPGTRSRAPMKSGRMRCLRLLISTDEIRPLRERWNRYAAGITAKKTAAVAVMRRTSPVGAGDHAATMPSAITGITSGLTAYEIGRASCRQRAWTAGGGGYGRRTDSETSRYARH